jgi:hypothetical protein
MATEIRELEVQQSRNEIQGKSGFADSGTSHDKKPAPLMPLRILTQTDNTIEDERIPRLDHMRTNVPTKGEPRLLRLRRWKELAFPIIVSTSAKEESEVRDISTTNTRRINRTR